MASSVKYLRVPPNSGSLEEARRRVFEFFKTACRSIPTIMEIYVLDDVVSPSQLRSTIASEIRKNAHVTNPKVIDMLLFKGTEELNLIVEHSKQRHHMLGQYVLGHNLIHDQGNNDTSDFLQKFYKGNYY
ncbi:hypothetical protein BUALT_Bualt19G0052900 [Buddleja alternifolia]|uniref:NADH dehydrogenase [ubiquinone] 1 alpha subcomplex subunit 6 n=1 Tax=Buddleja alternifolia TaxID=168488 RepID=A0AAV6W5G8_9LAMI|nr:hypothetical protein BUALT_Bualt19G0052900 [Buddleja alternifolia]